MAHIFFSYSRKDKIRVDQIIKLLQQHHIDVWLDRTGIRGGEEWRGEIVSAIKEADVVVLLLSPNSILSENVRKEVDVSEMLKKHILPIQFEETQIPENLLYQLAGIQIVDMSGDLDDKIEDLVAGIISLMPGTSSAVVPTVTKKETHTIKPPKIPLPVILAGVLGALLLIYFIISAANSPQVSTQTSTPNPTDALNLTPSLLAVVNLQTATPTSTVPPTALPSSTPAPTLGIPVTGSTTPLADRPPACTAVGQTWVRPKDKAILQCVPAGSFVIGYPNCKAVWCQNEAAQGSVDVAAFWIDRTEVTNAQFSMFVDASGYVTAAESSGLAEVYGILQAVPNANWRSPQGLGSTLTGKDNHPVVQMNWFSADAYCQWAGGRLPSELQWEKAARGPKAGLFPWGDDYPGVTLLNSAGNADGFAYTSPVGSFLRGKSPYGLFDMAGNVFEWTRSMMKSYPYAANDGREVDGEPSTIDKMVIRGGSFYTDTGTVRSTYRVEILAQSANDGTGFRCVIDQ